MTNSFCWIIIFILDTLKDWPYHSSIPKLAKTSHCLPIKTHLFPWHLMSIVILELPFQLRLSLLPFVNCILQFFSQLECFWHSWRDNILLCDDTGYRIFGLLDFSTENANSTFPSLWQPKMPPPISEPPMVILYSCSRSFLELHLLSCLHSLFFCFLGLKCLSFMSSFPNLWCLNEIIFIPSSKRFLLPPEFPRQFIFIECLSHARQSCSLLYIYFSS